MNGAASDRVTRRQDLSDATLASALELDQDESGGTLDGAMQRFLSSSEQGEVCGPAGVAGHSRRVPPPHPVVHAIRLGHPAGAMR